MKRTRKFLSLILTLSILLSTVLTSTALAATVSVKCDTTGNFSMAQGKTYAFKVTPVGTNIAPRLTTGNSKVIKVISITKKNKDYYCCIKAVGLGSTGVYTTLNGQSTRQCIVTVNAVTQVSEKSVNVEDCNPIIGTIDGIPYDEVAKNKGEDEYYNNGKTVKIIIHTVVGDVDVGTVDTYEGQAAIVAKAFERAHPTVPVSYSRMGAGYDMKPLNPSFSVKELEDFCDGNPNNIKHMTIEQLYELSGIVGGRGGSNISEYREAFEKAWATAGTGWSTGAINGNTIVEGY